MIGRSSIGGDVEFEVTPEREQLRTTVRRAVEELAGEDQIRAAMDLPSGLDETLWDALTQDLGVVTLRVPVELGGPGATFRDVAVVLEELGRGPVCSPYLGTAVLVPELLRRAATPAALESLAELARSGALATASLEPDPDVAGSIAVAARLVDGEYLLDGVDRFVIEAGGADAVLLPALLDGEVAVFQLAGAGPGVTRTELVTMDQTRRVARVACDAAPAKLIVSGQHAVAALGGARDVARVALAFEQVGGASRCLELAVEYAKVRRQFGVPIGSFQAVKHRCADMLAAIELSRSTAEYAAWCVDERPDDLAIAARVAASHCAETYLDVSAGNIQVHGGIGFVWDNPAHLYFKRAKSSALMFGQPVQQRAELANLLGL